MAYKTIPIAMHSRRLLQKYEFWKSDLPSDALLVRGDAEALCADHPSIAIIGTRRPTPYGIRFLRSFFAELRGYDWNIISGGAFGIDSEAHRLALHYGFRTQAWVVGPIAKPSPQAHKALYEKIESTKGSAIIVPSFLEGEEGQVLKSYWLLRNRWIAASASALIVVEAAIKSGTWSTVDFAGKIGIPVYALPGAINAPQSEGTNAMISGSYANPILSVGKLVQSLVEDLGETSYNKTKATMKVARARSPSDEDKVLNYLRLLLNSCGGQDLKGLVSRATEHGFDLNEVARALKVLRQKGEVASLGDCFERKGALYER